MPVLHLPRPPTHPIIANQTNQHLAEALLIGAGLVDEDRLFVYPVVLGRGRRLVPDGTDVPTLRLAEARPFRSGVVLLRYRPAPA